MTLAPLENRKVRAVASERYLLNQTCASPMSDAGTKADEAHHCFRRSQIGGDSYFVEIENEDGTKTVIPHVVGLSREQHRRITEHEAWIRYEDGTWNWYERVEPMDKTLVSRPEEWELVGPLNPQPGSREGKPKRKKHKGEARRKRTTISIRVPQDDLEDGAGIWDDLMDQAQSKLKADLELGYDPSPFKVLTAVLYSYLTGAE